MNIIFTVIISVSICFIAVYLAKKAKIPHTVALILAGLLIGATQLRDILISPNTDAITLLGEIGLYAIMFLAGLEISWSTFYKERKDSFILTTFCVLFPFILGFSALYLLGFPFATAVVVGICMSISAEAVIANTLMDSGKLKTKLGSLMMGAGIIDDLIGIILFILISYAFVHMISLSEFTLLLLAVASFFAGILVHKAIHRSHFAVKKFEKYLNLLIIPFFFIAMGLNFSFDSLMINPILLVVIILVAMAGKFLGALLTKPFTEFSWKQMFLVGWGMNSRGAIELAIAMIALKIGALSIELYSAIVIMAFATTIIFPFIFSRMTKKDKKIMNSTEK
jgi:Kef-type K+ transport system membrane component KefB